MRPAEQDRHQGLAYSLWQPAGKEPASAGVLVLHGAGSSQESHYDFARAALPLGLAVLTFDARGHGVSDGPMDGRALGDVAAMAALLRSHLPRPDAPVALRGSSMGGCLALLASADADAAAVVAICPATLDGLRRGLAREAFNFAADGESLDALLDQQDLHAAAQALNVPVLLLHAEGDEVVPVQHSLELASGLSHPDSRLIAVPGGHHRSVQHDPELQAVSLRFLTRVLHAGHASTSRS